MIDGSKSKCSRVFLGWEEQSRRSELAGALTRGESVELRFDRALSQAILNDLNFYEPSALCRLVYVPNHWFLKSEALASVPIQWRDRTYEEELYVEPSIELPPAKSFSYAFEGLNQLRRGQQLLVVVYTGLSVLRVGFWSAILTFLGPRLKYFYPVKKLYWFARFQIEKAFSKVLGLKQNGN